MIRRPKASPADTATHAAFASEDSAKRARAIPRRTRARDPGMTYIVKEIFYTLQGEGQNTGRPAVFCRFAGCNLWTGREADREAAVCRFCDTDFVGTDGPGGGRFADAAALADTVAPAWPPPPPRPPPSPQTNRP